MMNQGRFVVIEGLEGAGKTTAIETVQQWLREQGHPLVQTREPGGTPLAEQIRTLVKSVQQEKVSPVTELLLMYAARAQLLDNVIRPALARGDWVLADRHDLSSRAYQGGGRQIPDEVLDPIRQLVLADLRPDLTLYLDIDPVIGLERARARGELDRIEQEQLGFFQRARAKYLAVAASEANIVVIDAAKPLADVQQQLRVALEQHFA
ncbi:MAG: dTMP kinase [Rheinheimera sp.]|nr:MAG: dTMP kinase [Rheinheimera sp.]